MLEFRELGLSPAVHDFFIMSLKARLTVQKNSWKIPKSAIRKHAFYFVVSNNCRHLYPYQDRRSPTPQPSTSRGAPPAPARPRRNSKAWHEWRARLLATPRSEVPDEDFREWAAVYGASRTVSSLMIFLSSEANSVATIFINPDEQCRMTPIWIESRHIESM